MRVRRNGRPLLWLLLPTLIAQGVLATSSDSHPSLGALARRGAEAADPEDLAIASSSKLSDANKDIGTKDAPVDGRDGKPHAGPWVGKDTDSKKSSTDTKKKVSDGVSRLEKAGDGSAIPDKNDGVMDDPNRKAPEKGTTGTEGGVSERSKKEKITESSADDTAAKKPKAPKEAPPLPHSEQEKIKESAAKSGKDTEKGDDSASKEKPRGAQGLEKPADLPDKPKTNSAADIPKKGNYLVDTLPYTEGQKRPPPKTAPKTSDGESKSGAAPITSGEPDEGLIQPLHSFVLALVMILFSEVGDKTFLVAALMAMRHDRLVVFSAAFSALIAMTVLSAVLGHAVPSLLPRRFVALAAAGLFFVFGAKLLREGLAMPRDSGVGEEMREVEAELEEKEQHIARRRSRGASLSVAALEAGRGRSGTIGRGSNLPPRADSPASEGSRSPSPSGVAASTSSTIFNGLNNLFSLVLSPAWVQTFVMTFLGEWGDRSQIATIAMAAGQDYWWVTGGAVCGHAVCTGVAVIGGRALAGRVSMRVVTIGGAVAFLVFGVVYFGESFYT
ncbi:UPF0016-domain-containing protein [Myriangium duriaei CBS 260.36]|uniref:UPF0016-domain-containing protein n=1 Tax=Myriangium duriaei CBS 260.36 TaxID=1168546 RepID=A0A9P4J510_9PEZI|nr:UPF0016-domain-containing protein [Myriangium duriaei CBS 260.36]